MDGSKVKIPHLLVQFIFYFTLLLLEAFFRWILRRLGAAPAVATTSPWN